MATIITITVEDNLNQQEVEDMRYLFTDALGDFFDKRVNVEKYVEAGYSRAVFGDKYLDDKARQVHRRIVLARKLHNPCLSFQVMDGAMYVEFKSKGMCTGCGIMDLALDGLCPPCWEDHAGEDFGRYKLALAHQMHRCRAQLLDSVKTVAPAEVDDTHDPMCGYGGYGHCDECSEPNEKPIVDQSTIELAMAHLGGTKEQR